MAKKLSDTEKLVLWFVREFLQRDFSYNTDRRFLKEASFYVNPKTDKFGNEQKKYSVEQVKGCLLHMRALGKKPLNSIHCIAWANREGKTYLEEYCEQPLPPLYMTMEVEQWKTRNESRL
jgi:hypothetical protein